MHCFVVDLSNCTMNVHLVRHLIHYVKLYGPLWTHSCFWFETLNGQLLRLRHGTHHVSLQVYTVKSTFSSLWNKQLVIRGFDCIPNCALINSILIITYTDVIYN